jgi:hypothetical protein
MALPLKLDKNKKKEIKANNEDKKEINKRNEEKNENINNEEDYIDYNRFTFRNSESPNQRKKRERKNRIKNKEIEKPLYNEESSDNDINKNINIDAYNRRYENKIIHNLDRDRYKNRYVNYKHYQKIKKNSEEFSPNFKQKINPKINSYQKKINNPYSRKNNFKEQYSSPRPLPKNQIKKKHVYINDNISEKNERTYQNEYNIDSGNESEYSFNSFRSLNPGKIYRKQILNNSFQINEILININDSDDYSYNTEKNYYRKNNHMRNDRSPMNRKENTTNNNILLNHSPLSSKQINSIPYDYSDYYESQPEDEYKNSKNKITNYSRFMQPFTQKEKILWNKEDGYLSFDIENLNKKNLYKKPIQNISNQMNKNKNNSMYIKQIVHYDNKKNSFFNDSDDSFLNKKNTSYNEINNNVYDFDAPKSIHDFLDDKLSNNSSIYANDSSRENKFNTNSGFHSERNKNDAFNNKNNQVLSFREEEKPKMVYTKKIKYYV